MNPTSKDVFADRSDWGCDLYDARKWGEKLPPNSIHCIVTSPPYYGLRDYGKEEQIGLEASPAEYVLSIVDVFRPLQTALHPSGVVWLNLGDSYNNSGSSNNGMGLDGKRRGGATGAEGECGYKKRDNRHKFKQVGIKHKDLFGIPWMVAFALRNNGWYLRQWMPWVKRGCMPESVTDRPGTACETVFLLSREPDYFFDMEAVKKPSSMNEVTAARRNRADSGSVGTQGLRGSLGGQSGQGKNEDHKGDSRNMRSADFWFDSVGMLLAGHLDDSDDEAVLGFDCNLEPYKGAHFAAFPRKLIRPMIQAGTSQKGVCPHCGEPWARITERNREATRPGNDTKVGRVSPHSDSPYQSHTTAGNRDPQRHVTKTKTVGWEPGCDCKDNIPIPAVVADPFCGSGTTLSVARSLNRRSVGCELNEKYHLLIDKRMQATDQPLF